MNRDMKKIGIGYEDYKRFIDDDLYYVDKTLLIRDIIEKGGEVTLFTRPRRFGKTLALSMLRTFFECECDRQGNKVDNSRYFEGMKIMDTGEEILSHMGQYPVIKLSLKSAKQPDFRTALLNLKREIVDEFSRHDYLLDSNELNDNDIAEYKKYRNPASASDEDVDFSIALKTLSQYLKMHHKKNVIILLDEYDVPLENAYYEGFYKEMVGFIRSLFESALKTNDALERGIITGCLRISKESIFTGLNHLNIVSIRSNEYAEGFGFTQAETEGMLDHYGLNDKVEEVKEWYDGYIFGNSYVYCPWDVINYLSALKKRKDAKPKNYWKNTSHNGILLTFVKSTDFDVADKFEILLNGGTITQVISDELTYDTLHSTEDNLWSVLLMTGYITKSDPEEDGDTVSLKIPNKEISSIFEDTVVKYFNETVNTAVVGELINTLWNGDEKRATEIVSELLWNTISYNDYHEDYYHAFLAGVFVGRGYSVESNKEKGLGRPDILLKDRKNRRAMIIEAKKSDKESDLDKDCDKALKQIIDEKYAEGIDGYEQIVCYGVAFFQKQAKAKVKLLTNK